MYIVGGFINFDFLVFISEFPIYLIMQFRGRLWVVFNLQYLIDLFITYMI